MEVIYKFISSYKWKVNRFEYTDGFEIDLKLSYGERYNK